MSLEFVIIPVSKAFNDSAYELQEKLHSKINRNVCVKIDEEFSSSMNARITDWQDKDYDVITISASYVEDKKIAVRFNDNKGSRPENMLVDDFIELVNSFEIEEEEAVKEEEDGGCIIM